MTRIFPVLALLSTLLFCLPNTSLAQTRVTGTLEDVHLASHLVVVDGTTYDVDTQLTQVIYRGEEVGEESLLPGDLVELVLAPPEITGGRPQLLAILLLRGSKTGLDS